SRRLWPTPRGNTTCDGGRWPVSGPAMDLDDGGGSGLDGQADSRARVGGQRTPFAVPWGVARDRGSAERGPGPPGVSRLPAGEGHDLHALRPWTGWGDRHGRIGSIRPVCLIDDRDVILARSPYAIRGHVDAARVLDVDGLDLPGRAKGERFDAVSLRIDRI